MRHIHVNSRCPLKGKNNSPLTTSNDFNTRFLPSAPPRHPHMFWWTHLPSNLKTSFLWCCAAYRGKFYKHLHFAPCPTMTGNTATRCFNIKCFRKTGEPIWHDPAGRHRYARNFILSKNIRIGSNAMRPSCYKMHRAACLALSGNTALIMSP